MEEKRTVETLRQYLYQKNGWECPEEPLVCDMDAINRDKHVSDRIKKECNKYAESHNIKNKQCIKEGTLSKEGNAVKWFQILDIITDIGLLINLLSNVKDEHEPSGIDQCLAGNQCLWELSEGLDYLLSLAVASVFEAKYETKDISEISDLIICILLCICNYTLNKIPDNKKDQGEEDKVDVLQEIDDETEIEDINIDTSGLKIGDVIKNYKELCAVIKQNYKPGGKVRTIQLKEFKRFFDWEKSGQKFIITDVYDTPLPKIDKRKAGNNSKYVKCIELILLNYLSKQNGYTSTLGKKDWWRLLGMVNQKYDQIPAEELKDVDPVITSYEIKHFYQRSNKKLEEILFSALNSLRSRRLIEYEIQTIIVYNDESTKRDKYHVATDYEKKLVLNAERFVLHHVYGYEKMIQIFLRFKQNDFYRTVNQRLNELYGWDHYFKRIKIIYTKQDVIEAIPTLETELKKAELNEKVVDTLNTNALQIYDRKKKEFEETSLKLFENLVNENNDDQVKLWRIPSTYVMAQELLTDELVRIGHQQMDIDLKKCVESVGEEELDGLFLMDR